VNDAEKFRKQAEDAHQMAAQSVKEGDKAFRLRIAEHWRRLAEQARRNASGSLFPLNN
jgi:hypothetical protein